MNKIWIFLTISILWIAFRSSQLFEGRFQNPQEVKASYIEERFFLPFPKDANILTSAFEGEFKVIVIETIEKMPEIASFYEEILRSKNYEKEFYFDTPNSIEFQYSKGLENVSFTISSIEGKTNIIIKHQD